MFSTDLIESKQERVAINGVEPQMVGMLVSYAYTSEVYISKANVQVRKLFCCHTLINMFVQKTDLNPV